MGRFWDALQVLVGDKPSGQIVAQIIPTWQSARPIPTKINYAAYVKEGYKGNPVIFACIREIVSSASEPVWMMDHGEDTEPIKKHDLLNLLKRPNPEQDGVSFLAQGLTHQHVWGDWYVHKVRSRGKRVVQLWNLRPDRVEIKRKANGSIDYYGYYQPSTTEEIGGKMGAPIPVPPEDVIHMKWEDDPESDNYGLSPITVLARLGDLDTSAIDYLRAFFMNQGIPAGMLKLQNRVQKEERDRIKGLFKDEYQGLKNPGVVSGGAGGWHGVMVLDATVEYEQIAAPTEKLKIQPLFDVTEARICAVFNVPPILVGVLVGLEHSTYANYKEARRSLWEETLAPAYRKLGTSFTNGLVHEFGENEETRILPNTAKIPALQDDKFQLSTKTIAEWESELITRNEARSQLGYEEIDDKKGDVFFSEAKPKPEPAFPRIGPDGKPIMPKIGPDGKPIPVDPALLDNGEPQDDDKGKPALPPGKNNNLRMLPAARHARRDEAWAAFIRQAEPLELAVLRDVAKVIATAAQDTLTEVRRQSIPAATLATVPTPEEVKAKLVKVAEAHLPAVMRAGWEFGVSMMQVERHSRQRHAIALEVAFDLLNPFVARYISERPYEYAAAVAFSVVEDIREQLNEGVGRGETIDELASRIEAFENVGSMTRGRVVARTEVVSAMNGAALESYRASRVVPRKSWLTARDDRVRGTRPRDAFNHVEADGQTVAVDQDFIVSGERLQYPGDPSGSLGNIIQCRCTILPVTEQEHAYSPSQPRAPKGDPTGGQWVDDDPQGEFPLSDKRGVPAAVKEKKITSQEEIKKKVGEFTNETPLTEDDLLNPGESVHKVYLIKTEDGEQFVIKPMSDDERQPSDLGRAIEDGGVYKRAVAGSAIAEMVGDGDMVPKVMMGEVTIEDDDDDDDVGDGDGGVVVDASISEYVPKARTGARAYRQAKDEDQERAAYFDFVLGNTDRHEGNWMVTEDGRRMKLIDNDMILPDYDLEVGGDDVVGLSGDVRLSYMMDPGKKDWQVKYDHVDRWTRQLDGIKTYLRRQGFADGVIEGFESRLDYLHSRVGESWTDVLKDYDKSRHGSANRWGH